jgi:DNA-binding CsgD family transcriptional regulator/cell division protein FtsL
MTIPKLLLFFGTLLLSIEVTAQVPVPISSIYQNLRDDKTPEIEAIYKQIDAYYFSRITVNQLSGFLEKMPASSNDRVNAVKNMALSYTKSSEEDFGFYNLRMAVNYADKLKDNDIVKGVVYAEFGNYLFYRETHDLAIEFLRKSVPILDTYKPVDMEGAGFSLQNKILRSFQELGENDSVNLYMNKVIEHAKLYKNTLWLSSSYNNKGYRFYESGAFDSAMQNYRLALQYLNQSDTEHLIFYENINENIAHIEAKNKLYSKALMMLDKVIDVRLLYSKELFGAIKALNYYTDYAIASGQGAAAIEKFNKSLPLLGKSGVEYQTNERYLELKMKLAKTAGDFPAYLRYYNLLIEKKSEKLNKEKQLLEKRKGINKYVKSRNAIFEQQLEIEKLQKAKLSQSVAFRNTLILVLLLLSAVVVYAIYAYNRYKKKLLESRNEQLQQREKILDLENINLKNNIELKERDISRVVADNKLRTEIKKEFLKQLEHLDKVEEKRLKTEIKKLSARLEQTVDQHDKINLLQNHITDINAQFEAKLRQTIPAITQSEIEICSLIRLGYNNTDIANIVNKTPENVRVNKFRIKQKAGLEDMSELEMMLKAMA